MIPGMTDYQFPTHRPRRLRRGQIVRDAVADVSLTPQNLILPVFISNASEPRPVSSMPGVSQLPVVDAVKWIEQLASRGLTQFILFGVTPPDKKDAAGSYAADPEAPVNRTLKQVRDKGLDVVMYCDLCFCEYTDHGHCGVLLDDARQDQSWIVDNDKTLEILANTAAAQARFGADVVAPSGMMDGMVAAIRRGLDDSGFIKTPICSYSVKYASSMYGPFRDAGEGAMDFGTRQGYQMDYRRSREWKTELQADLAEGADMVMVKPAAAYLDIIRQVRDNCSVPVVAYHVSGEYSMIHAAAERGWLDLEAAAVEVTYAIRRAGADLILSYFAPQMLDWL